MLRAPALKTAGTVYAFASGEDLVVKLPAVRVSELIATGTGRPCDPTRGRPMRQWVRLSPADDAVCAAYVRESRRFVAADAAP